MLGGLSATVDGTPVTLPADARARELLAYLAVHPGPHSRQRLAGVLRPEVAEESARKTLRDAVYELRRAFAPAEPVVATRAAVELRAEVDLASFRALRAAGDLEACVRVAGAGELLAGLDTDWALRARDEHMADVAAVLAALAEQATDVAGAIRWTRGADRARAAMRGRAPRPDPAAGALRRSPGGAGHGRRAGRAAAARAGRPAVGRDARAGRGGPARARRRRRCRRAAPRCPRRWPGPPARRAARHRCGGCAPLGRRLRGHAAVRGRHRRAGDRQDDAARRARAPRARRGRRGAVRAQRRAGPAALPAVGRGAGAHLHALPPVERERRLGDGALARLLPTLGDATMPRTGRATAARRRCRAVSRVRSCAIAARGGRRASGRFCSSSTTCTGPTPTRCTSCATSRGWRTAHACWSRSRCAKPRSRRPRRRRSPTCAAKARCSSWSCAGSTRTRWRPCWRAATATRRRRRLPRAHRRQPVLSRRAAARRGRGRRRHRPAAGRARGDRPAHRPPPVAGALRAAGGRRAGPRVRAAGADHARTRRRRPARRRRGGPADRASASAATRSRTR